MSTGGEHGGTRALDVLERSLRVLRDEGSAEVFARWTRRVRVELADDRTRVAHGMEEGTAVRLRAHDGAVRFGAASGIGPQAVAAADAVARSVPGGPAPEWGTGGPWIDLEGPATLPPAAEAEAWLRRAVARSPGGTGARAHLDAAVTVEVLGSLDGLRACRSRGVVWARLLRRATVRSAVADGLDDLDPEDWDEPEAPEATGASAIPAGPLALLPGAVGGLAPALVAAVHVPSSPGGVGPGWVCEDEGGAFDDTGFPSGRLLLADGKGLLAAPRGPGRRWRLSFRTPPLERAAHLRFRPGGAWDGSGLLARAARPLPGDGGTWWTVLEAAPALEGRLLAPWAPWVVNASAGAWVAGCRAGVGRVRRAPEGVTAPTLVFEGLPAAPLGP